MRHHSRTSVLVLCLAIFPAAAGAQTTAPSLADQSWDKVLSLPPQTEVTIVLESGKKRQFLLGGATGDTLRLLTASGQQETLAKREIAQVLRRGVNDDTRDGLIAGAGIGAATTALLTGVAYAVCGAYSSHCYGRPAGQAIAIAAGAGAAAGAALGWAIDKMHKGTEQVYSAPSARAVRIGVVPVVGARERRVILTVGF